MTRSTSTSTSTSTSGSGSGWSVPLVDLGPGIEARRAEIESAIARVIASGVFIDGPEVGAFEEEMAHYLGVRCCVGLNSGTDALVIGLRALGVGRGDEVIVPAFTFVATAEAVGAVGAVPVFVDIDPRTFNLEPAGLDAAVTSRTRAVIPVHLYGQAAPLEPILAWADAHGLPVLEDVAQALGGRYRGRRLGSFGLAAALSFFPSKTLGAFGDGGLLATSSPELARVARALRQHGGRDKYASQQLGYNSRLDSIQAAVLRAKLPHLDSSIALRREVAARYDELLRGVSGVHVPHRHADGEHAFHQYTVRVPAERRGPIQSELEARGIQTAIYYPTPLHRLPVFASQLRERSLPNADAAAQSVLSLPIWPEMPLGAQERVTQALALALGASP